MHQVLCDQCESYTNILYINPKQSLLATLYVLEVKHNVLQKTIFIQLFRITKLFSSSDESYKASKKLYLSPNGLGSITTALSIVVTFGHLK